MTNLWRTLFLEERPSIGLAFFRIAVALTTGLHVLPSFLHLEDNYFQTALKAYNFSFFTPGAVELVQKSSDGVVVFFIVLFCVTWFFFLIGLFTKISCILMVLSCYYFYALNEFHIGGKLSWDILLVVLFLMCVTPYAGDYFSVDCLRRKDPLAYKRKRPFFLQRLLQLQIASSYFYTGLYKITPPGNWLTGNPMYYLMNYPPAGCVKNFLLKEFLAGHPQLCYGIGILIATTELLMPFLLFYPRTRRSAIILGFIFHVLLVWTLHVPTIFFFLFPPQLLLFIHPDRIVEWIEKKRAIAAQGVQSILVYDGRCRFCLSNVRMLRVMDLWNTLKMVDYNEVNSDEKGDLPGLHPDLTMEHAASQLHLIEPEGTLYAGYFVLRRLSWKMPMLYPLIPVFYFPGTGLIGPWVYRWVAKNRYLFHFNKTCKDNCCFMPERNENFHSPR